MQRIFRQSTVAACLVACAFVGTAAHAQQALVPAQSHIQFTSTQMGVPVQGKFQQFEANIQFNPSEVAKSTIAMKINTASATLGDAATDKNLKDEDWFNVRKFAQATFQSESVKSLGGQKYQVDGTLSMKGKNKKISVPVQLEQNGAHTTATGTFSVGRLDFGIGDGDWADTSMIANEVKVNFKLVLTGVEKLK